MAYITTYTGKHFDPIHPDPELIDIRDIAHALSLTCRGNGQVKTFFSVGQHCIVCAKEAEARGLPRRMVLACLLHDAGECYLSDVPSPVKKVFEDYREIENNLLDVIYRKYLGSALDEPEQKQLDEIDHGMLAYDLENLLGEAQTGKMKLHVPLDYTVRPFEETEREYLEMFNRLSAD